MSNFIIEKPKELIPTTWLGRVSQFLTIPVSFLKMIVNHWLGESIGKLVLPAQNPSIFDSTVIEFHASNLNAFRDSYPAYMFQKHTVTTYDGAILDTVEIQPNSLKDTPIQAQHYIINFVGNSDAFEHHYDDMVDQANKYSVNVIGFNLRGVLRSQKAPKSQTDLITDGIAQVQRLLDAGVNPEHIVLKGESLGAAIATAVAGYFHQQGQKVYLFNGRSFSTLTNEVVGQIRQIGVKHRTGYNESFVGIILGYIAMPWIKLLVYLSQWDMQPIHAYQGIPEHYKMYYLVRSPKISRDTDLIDDRVIPHYASIHKALRKAERHSDRKVLGSRDCGHCRPERSMFNKEGKNITTLFGMFVQHSLTQPTVAESELGVHRSRIC